MYTLRLERHASKALKKLPEPTKSRIVRALDEMEKDPFDGDIKALSGKWKGYFRKRVGAYRILYTVDTEVRVVSVDSISHRKNAY